MELGNTNDYLARRRSEQDAINARNQNMKIQIAEALKNHEFIGREGQAEMIVNHLKRIGYAFYYVGTEP